MKLRDMSDEEKPRERLKNYGLHALSNGDLLALILGKGTSKQDIFELSQTILKKIPLKNMRHITLPELTKISGIGLAKAAQIIASIELGKRMNLVSTVKKDKISNKQEAFHHLTQFFTTQQEILAGLFLDSRKRIICKKILFIGTIDKQLISSREIVKTALDVGAVSVIIAHNHPSGSLSPSDCDFRATEKISEALEFFDIQLLDHLIITNDKVKSIYE